MYININIKAKSKEGRVKIWYEHFKKLMGSDGTGNENLSINEDLNLDFNDDIRPEILNYYTLMTLY